MSWKEKVNDIVKQVGPLRLGLLLICGIFLIYVSLPSEQGDGSGEMGEAAYQEQKNTNDLYIEKMEGRLEDILHSIEGVGNAEVMITLASSSEAVIQQDETKEDSSEKENGESTRESASGTIKKETVLVDEDGDKIPYVIKTMEPAVEGVMIVMEGGGNSSVVTAVTEAVQALFSIEPHKIKVLKMEGGL